MLWNQFLMKKLLKSEICESVNSSRVQNMDVISWIQIGTYATVFYIFHVFHESSLTDFCVIFFFINFIIMILKRAFESIW